MSSCEKCWKDAGGDPDKYHRLIQDRLNNPCTPEEQAGEFATICPNCQRKTIHQYTQKCMNVNCKE